MNALPVNNPAARRIAAELGYTVTTDQLGKDTADTSMGVLIESRYFINGVLVERAIGRNNAGNATFEWTTKGETFGSPTQAFAHAVR